MRNKLVKQNGETLIEALISLLIAILAMGMLTTTVMVANKMNATNRQKDQEYAQNLAMAEGCAQEGVEDKVLRIQFESLTTKHVDITLYGGASNHFVSYETKESLESEP